MTIKGLLGSRSKGRFALQIPHGPMERLPDFRHHFLGFYVSLKEDTVGTSATISLPSSRQFIQQFLRSRPAGGSGEIY
jgi:hypothetical protein